MAPRRANGEGTKPRLHKSGLYTVQVMLNGQRRSFYGPTAAKAIAAMRSARQPAGPATVGSWLVRYQRERLGHIRPLTRDSYRMLAERHIIPTLGSVRLARLSADQVRDLLADKLASGLSASSVGHIHDFLRAALAEAERDGLVERNVAKLVRPPKVEHPEIRPLTEEQARRFLAAIDGDPLEPLFVTAITTGMRQGELLGMTWHDVDLDAARLEVRLTLQYRHGAMSLEPPKTAKSRRVLPLPAMTVRMLRRWKATQAAEQLRYGKDWYDADLVFTGLGGVPLRGYTVTKALVRILSDANLPRQRFHDLRHAAASFLIASGVHPRVVMEQLGHSTINLTMNTYGHVDQGPLRQAADTMDETLRMRK